jgi:hypothetical protein
MTAYVTNKLTSFLAVFVCIGASYALFGNTTQQWQAILLAIILFGYGHFLVGFYYQIKGFFRKPQPWRYVGTFMVLTIASIGFAYATFFLIGFMAALLIGFIYFLLHGLLNEQTLIKRQTGAFVSLWYLGALAIFVIALLIYSVPDETFFFDQYLQFTAMNDLTVTYAFEQYYLGLAYFTHVFWVGVGLSALLLLAAWLRYRQSQLTFFLLSILVAATAGVYVLGPPAYIYMYVFVVGYHFMTWLLFYLVEMKKRGTKVYYTFIWHNVVALTPFAIAAYYFLQPQTPTLAYQLLNYQLFVVLTYIHISTSFLNDAWLVQLQNRVYDKFSRQV